MVHLEVCCDGLESTRIAYKAGARRVELCAALEVGGLTPSPGTVRLIKAEMPDMLVMAMLRPRAGGFCYKSDFYQQMLEDAKDLIAAGADGLVFGFLTADCKIDVERTREIVQICHNAGLEAVVHRAFDNCADVDAGMKTLIACHVDRVLTSGQAPTAPKGAEKLAYLQRTYGNRIQILAGAGITTNNLVQLLETSGVNQVHSTCKGFFIDPTTVGNVSYSLNLTDNPCELQTVNKDDVEACLGILGQYFKE